MGNSGENLSKTIDASVGALVWVRRGNGSWWPAQVLGDDEIPESSFPSPRIGTPIKLLGRDDASVEWYNLETSKKVKAFRCGEFDAYIEKAKASASNPSKKAVKYARREDAILEALEIESAACVGEDREHHHIDLDEDLTSSEDDSDSDSDSGPEVSQSGVRHTKGLEDLVMGGVKSERSQVAHLHEFSRKKRRCQTLTNVMERTAVVSDSKVSGVGSNDSKRNNSVVKSDSSGATCGNATELFHVLPLVAVEKNNKGASQKMQVIGAAQSSQSSHVEATSLGNDQESGATSSAPSLRLLKGKRNPRTRRMGMDGDGVKLRPLAEVQAQELRGWSWNGNPVELCTRGSTAEMPAPQRSLPYRQSRFLVVSPPGLYDVPVRVQSSYRPQRVPYISLMSKINSRPIVGHPIEIQVLKDGLCDDILDSVSESHSSSSESEYEVPSFRRADMVYAWRPRGRLPTKNRSLHRYASMARSAKLKKTRKLSSLITGSQEQNEEQEHKPVVEKVKGPVVACVPLKVVFSRINAALR